MSPHHVVVGDGQLVAGVDQEFIGGAQVAQVCGAGTSQGCLVHTRQVRLGKHGAGNDGEWCDCDTRCQQREALGPDTGTMGHVGTLRQHGAEQTWGKELKSGWATHTLCAQAETTPLTVHNGSKHGCQVDQGVCEGTRRNSGTVMSYATPTPTSLQLPPTA